MYGTVPPLIRNLAFCLCLRAFGVAVPMVLGALIVSIIALTDESCEDEAASLSSAFLSERRFNGSSTADLQAFLGSNGVLFTMCMIGTNCSAPWPPPPPPSAGPHWSGSWVSKSTGLHLVPGSALGVVAHPEALELRCIYPTDAGTDDRDEDGCGALIRDPTHGSHGASQMSPAEKRRTRLYIEYVLATQFAGKRWQEIPCDDLLHFTGTQLANASSWLPNGTGTDACAAMKRGERGIMWTSMSAVFAAQWEAVVGRKLCQPAPAPLDVAGRWFEYDGPCAWEPAEWQLMVDAMLRWFAPHTAVGPTGWWNEIVAKWPSSPAEAASIVRAVFYIKTANMDARTLAALEAAARQNAAMYAHVAVLELDVSRLLAGGPLFECAKRNETSGVRLRRDEVEELISKAVIL